MKRPPLTSAESEMLREVFRRYPEIRAVKIFGSRAKGTHHDSSDVDLAMWGEIDAFRAERIAGDLDDLSLPYRYDVFAFETITLEPLREHIDRVGVSLYSTATSAS